MEALKTLVKEVTAGISEGLERFVIVDELHIHDTQSGLKFHMYDMPDPFHITIFETGEEIAHLDDFVRFPDVVALFGELKDKLVEVHKAQTVAKEVKSTANRTNLISIYNRKVPTGPK